MCQCQAANSSCVLFIDKLQPEKKKQMKWITGIPMKNRDDENEHDQSRKIHKTSAVTKKER